MWAIHQLPDTDMFPATYMHTFIHIYIHKMAVPIQEIQFLLLLSSDSPCSHCSLLKFTASNYHL